MRLLRITTNYPVYLKNFYVSRPGLEDEGYLTQYQTLMADSFGWADFWTHALTKLGYEVWEPVGNAEAMQRAWAHENSIEVNDKNWLLEIVAAQVKKFRPTVLFVNDCSTYTREFLFQLRKECPSIRLVLGWCGAPFSDRRVFEAYDVVLSNIPNLVDFFRDNGHACEYMLHAFEPRILARMNKTQKPTINFSFLGSIVKMDGFHNQRERLLKKLVQDTELQIWSDIREPSRREIILVPLRQMLYFCVKYAQSYGSLKHLMNSISRLEGYRNMSKPPDRTRFVDTSIVTRSRPAVFGIEMYQKLQDSKITLNTHIDISDQFASNMRLFEATGVGTLLLTDWKKNLSEIFEPGKEVVAYRNSEECVELIRYYSENDVERSAIAMAGQKRTLRQHTYYHRSEELLEIVKKYLK